MLSNSAFRAKLTAYQDKAIRSRQGIDFAYLILPVSLKGKLYSPCQSEQPRWGAVGLQEHRNTAGKHPSVVGAPSPRAGTGLSKQ